MIISNEYRFIFVHVPKTAGTAMTAALEPYGVIGTRTPWRRFLRRLPLLEDPGRAYFRKHETAVDIQRKIGRKAFEGFMRFTVVRNPFDHAVSHYEYLKEFRNPTLAARFAGMTFADYLSYRTKAKGLMVPFFTVLPDQAHFLIEGHSTMLVPRLLRFETLARDFSDLLQELGLPDVPLARINPTQSKPQDRRFQDYYDSETQIAVQRLYARDFDLFGYSRDLPN